MRWRPAGSDRSPASPPGPARRGPRITAADHRQVGAGWASRAGHDGDVPGLVGAAGHGAGRDEPVEQRTVGVPVAVARTHAHQHRPRTDRGEETGARSSATRDATSVVKLYGRLPSRGMTPVAVAPAMVVAIYCRISIDKSGRREGVEAQERWGREYAAERWPDAMVRVFTDNNLSAARDDRRLGYDGLRAAIRAGEITHVWTVEQSRLERRKAPWFELAAELIAAGIHEMHTRRDGLVRLDDIGSDVRAIVNAQYVADLKKKIRDKSAELAREGRPSGAIVFGYRHGR